MGARQTQRRFGRRLQLLACVLFAAAFAPGAPAATLSDICTTGPTFDLQTTSGRISTPDGNSVFMWGFAPDPGSFQMPGPVLCVNQGQTVTVNLTNNLSEPVSIVFPGQQGVTATGTGPQGELAKEAAASGGTVSYSFVASEPGTYLYESGSSPHKQVQMGLYGALIVRPTMGANFAYNSARSQFDPDREFLILLHDIDPYLHQAVERSLPYDVTTKHDRYWTINGRSFPDTIADNFVSYLPSQPYGALVQVEPSTSTNDQPALVRYLNAGMTNHPMHPHANHLRVIGRDGRLLAGPSGEDTSFDQFTRTIASGQTYDLLFEWADEQWNPNTDPVPVGLPQMRNLVFKDNVTWYSGSPYLGAKAALPAGVVSYNICGEFYFPWHSHALNEFQNFDQGFGGLATLLRVDPPSGCTPPPPPAPDFTIQASPSSATATRPGSTTYTVTIGAVHGFTGNVTLSTSGLPAGASTGFSVNPVMGGSGSSTLTVTVAGATPTGSFPFQIIGTSGSLSHAANVTLVVTDPPPDFTIAASPASRTVTQGGSTTYTVTIGSLNGFTGAVDLSLSGPAGVGGTFSPDPVPGGSGTSTLTVTTTGATPVGTHSLTITGTSGTLSHATPVELVVDPAPPSGSFATEVLSDSPRAYWRLGEASGSTAADEVAPSPGNPGAYQNGVVLGVPGALVGDTNTAARFDGTNDQVSMGDPASGALDFGGGDFSVEAWIKTSFNGERIIVSKRASSTRHWQLSVTDDPGHVGEVRVNIYTAAGNSTQVYGPAGMRVDNGAWHHVVAVFDRDTAITVYVDGVSRVNAGAMTGNVSSAGPFLIGFASSYFYFRGDIDEVAVYPGLLSAARVQAHYDAGT